MDLKVGDTIKCTDPDDLIENMTGYAKAGVNTDFLREVDGIKGYYLVVTSIEEGGGDG